MSFWYGGLSMGFIADAAKRAMQVEQATLK